MKASVISHQFLEAPDWAALRQSPPRDAADALASLLTRLDPIEKQVFALRGIAMLVFEERELWTEFTDPDVGQPYASFDRWLKQTCPNSWSYCRDALRSVKELRSVPFEDLLQIKRCNLEQLKKVSSGVRLLPDVVKAAKTMPEKQFVEKMNREHSQHLEVKQPVMMAPGEVCEIFEQAVNRVIVFYGCTRAEALEHIGSEILEKYTVEEVEDVG